MTDIKVGATRLVLLPQRAVFVPAYGALLVADAHIGKAQTFRRLGVPVPAGTTNETLQRLSEAVRASGAQRVVFLGDLLHSARWRSPGTWAAMADWRAAHPALDLTLVRGNHDRRAGDPPAEWRVQCVAGPLALGDTLALVHEPAPLPGRYVLAGHVHPGVLLGHRSHERLRLPCFRFGADVGLLPAFGAFTGLHLLPRSAGERLFAIADDRVREVP